MTIPAKHFPYSYPMTTPESRKPANQNLVLGICYDASPEAKKLYKDCMKLQGIGFGALIASGPVGLLAEIGLNKLYPATAKKGSYALISAIGLGAAIFLGYMSKAVPKGLQFMKKYPGQGFMLKNVDLHALRGGNAQQVQRLR